MDIRHALGTWIKMNSLTKFVGQKGLVIRHLGSDSYLLYLFDQDENLSFHGSEFDAFAPPEVVRITNPDQLAAFRLRFNLRNNWHGSINHGITAQIRGTSFDNTDFWGTDASEGRAGEELHVIFLHDGDEVAMVNLADLCAWVTGYRG